MTDIRQAQFIARSSDGKLQRRPVSPHIGIYRWPVTMAASILNRASGVALTLGMLMLVCWLVAAAAGPAEFDKLQGFLAAPLGLFMLFGWTAALYYHFFAGLRHLAWDIGYGFAKPSLDPITWVIFGLTAGATIVTWVAGYIVLGS
jgi:succinate dehydrogenase / fumarate reductase cytochrome b subunit